MQWYASIRLQIIKKEPTALSSDACFLGVSLRIWLECFQNLEVKNHIRSMHWLKHSDITILWVYLLCLLPRPLNSQPNSRLNDRLYSESGQLYLYSYLPLYWSCLQLQICFLHSRNMSLTSPWIAFQVPAASRPLTRTHKPFIVGRNKSVLPLLSFYFSRFLLVCHTGLSKGQITIFATSDPEY